MLDILYAKPSKDKDGNTPQKPIKWILVDSVIIALIALVAVMPTGIPTPEQLYVMLKAFIAAFIVEIAIERGLKGKPKE